MALCAAAIRNCFFYFCHTRTSAHLWHTQGGRGSSLHEVGCPSIHPRLCCCYRAPLMHCVSVPVVVLERLPMACAAGCLAAVLAVVVFVAQIFPAHGRRCLLQPRIQLLRCCRLVCNPVIALLWVLPATIGTGFTDAPRLAHASDTRQATQPPTCSRSNRHQLLLLHGLLPAGAGGGPRPSS